MRVCLAKQKPEDWGKFLMKKGKKKEVGITRPGHRHIGDDKY